MVGLLVELGVQRDDAAVGVLELAIEPRELVLALAQLGERAQQLLVLLLHLVERRRAALARAAPRGCARSAAARDGLRARIEQLACSSTVVPLAGLDAISHWSISRRAPMRPRPMPVVER